MISKDLLIEILRQADEDVLNLAVMSAISMKEYGVDITRTSNTAVSNYEMIQQVQQAVYDDAMHKRIDAENRRWMAIVNRAEQTYMFNQRWDYDYLVDVINELMELRNDILKEESNVQSRENTFNRNERYAEREAARESLKEIVYANGISIFPKDVR